MAIWSRRKTKAGRSAGVKIVRPSDSVSLRFKGPQVSYWYLWGSAMTLGLVIACLNPGAPRRTVHRHAATQVKYLSRLRPSAARLGSQHSKHSQRPFNWHADRLRSSTGQLLGHIQPHLHAKGTNNQATNHASSTNKSLSVPPHPPRPEASRNATFVIGFRGFPERAESLTFAVQVP